MMVLVALAAILAPVLTILLWGLAITGWQKLARKLGIKVTPDGYEQPPISQDPGGF